MRPTHAKGARRKHYAPEAQLRRRHQDVEGAPDVVVEYLARLLPGWTGNGAHVNDAFRVLQQLADAALIAKVDLDELSGRFVEGDAVGGQYLIPSINQAARYEPPEAPCRAGYYDQSVHLLGVIVIQ